jgi:hypothetical protein
MKEGLTPLSNTPLSWVFTPAPSKEWEKNAKEGKAFLDTLLLP